MSSSQIGKYTDKENILSILILELVFPNIYLARKPQLENIDLCFLHHSKGHLMSFTST